MEIWQINKYGKINHARLKLHKHTVVGNKLLLVFSCGNNNINKTSQKTATATTITRS